MKLSLGSLSLRVKLIGMIVILMGALSLFLYLLLPARMEAFSRVWAERRGKEITTILSDFLAPTVDAADLDETFLEEVPTLLDDYLSKLPGAKFAVARDAEGKSLGTWNPKSVPEKLAAPDELSLGYLGEDLVVHKPVVMKEGEGDDVSVRRLGVLTVGFSLEELENEKQAQDRLVAVVALSFLVVGTALAFLVGTYIVRPIQSMTGFAQKIAQGDLSQEELPVKGQDELGQMARAFNEMLRALREIAAKSEEMAKGNLNVEMNMKGQVGAVLNRMIEAQRVMVRQISEASVQLASAGQEIYAAAQSQESAAAQQSSSVEEVTNTMQSLLESATHIADSAKGVLGSAERNTSTADLTSQRIAELTRHANRIGEVLETIRDIADRSDLLALNASLEATRAGESGRSFSLVAAEMRRLAERVTSSVEDVKTLLADIRASGNSTVMATEEGRKFASSTTESARQISHVTQQQSTATEQVSESMRHIASLLAESVAGAQQTRTSAESLKSQADRLAQMVARFQFAPEGERTPRDGRRAAASSADEHLIAESQDAYPAEDYSEL